MKANSEMLKAITDKTKGRMLTLNEFMKETRAPDVKPIRPTTLHRGLFTCGDSDILGKVFKINVWVYGLAVEAKFPSMHKVVVNTNGIDENLLGHTAERSTAYTYKEPRDEQEEGMTFDKAAGDLTSAYYYGKQLVPMGELDSAATQIKAEKGIRLLAVKKRGEISMGDYTSGCMWVIPQPNDPHATLAIATLSKALEEEECVMIVSYVKDTRGNAKLALLEPVERNGIPGFAMVTKAFYEESKPLNFVPLPKATADQDAAADALIDAFDLDRLEQKDLFTPETTYNPTLHHFRLSLTKRACDKGDEKRPIQAPEPGTMAAIQPPAELLEAAKATVDAFKLQHPTERILDNVDKKRSAFGLDETEDEAAKRIKLEEEANKEAAASAAPLTVEDMMSKTPSDKLEVRSAEPLADFEEMVSRQDMDLWAKACKELVQVVHSLVSQSVRDLNYNKAYECIVGARKHCIAKGDAASYNTFVRSLKDSFEEGTRAGFWKMVLQGGKNSLISSDEVPSSTVSAEEAQAFLRPPKEEAVVKVEVVDDDDDMMDDFD